MNTTNHKSIYHISYLPLHLEELVQHKQVQVQPQLLPVYFLQHHGFHFPAQHSLCPPQGLLYHLQLLHLIINCNDVNYFHLVALLFIFWQE